MLVARLSEQTDAFPSFQSQLMLINGNAFLIAFLCVLSRSESLRSHFNLH